MVCWQESKFELFCKIEDRSKEGQSLTSQSGRPSIASGNCAVVTRSRDDVVKMDVVMMVARDGMMVSAISESVPVLMTWVVEVITVVIVPVTVRIQGGEEVGRVGSAELVSAVVVITVVLVVVR